MAFTLLKLTQNFARLAVKESISQVSRCVSLSAPSRPFALSSLGPIHQKTSPALPSIATPSLGPPSRLMASLAQMHRNGPPKKTRFNRKSALDRCPQKKGVVLKVIIKKPKKPNSANRKCVRVKLSNGKQIVAFIPGEGHNLQEHNIVLVRGGKKQDLPGVKHKVVRGKYDCGHVVKKTAM